MEQKFIELAVNNIVNYGDTDIFPYPIENVIFYDKKPEIIKLLQEYDKSFFEIVNKIPPLNINTCSPVGYTGFRWATQIDPLWNAYLLALVVGIAENIESNRIPIEKKVVYSYRYQPSIDDGSLFSKENNWTAFQKDSLEMAEDEECKFVVICDIADFYNRIYHHRLENALDRLKYCDETPKRIMKLLQKFSGTNSYGLPIGGPAARILAELALTGTDKILTMNGIKFKRFVDDYHIFCNSLEEAHSHLSFLAIKLLKNEGLSLQKHKTQILSKAEFKNLVAARMRFETDDLKEKHQAQFMALHIHYDPYSDNAVDEYEGIKEELSKYDIVSLLNEELRKSRIHQQFSKQILKSFNILGSNIVSQSFISICNKIESFYPIFPSLMMSLFANYDKLDSQAKSIVIEKLQEMVRENSYILQLELNVAYLVRVLGKEYSYENEEVLNKLFKQFPESILVRSIVMQVMAKWGAHDWLSDLKPNFHSMNKWERRVFIIASFVLGDEGKHWFLHNKKEFTKLEEIISEWVAEKTKLSNWEIPL